MASAHTHRAQSSTNARRSRAVVANSSSSSSSSSYSLSLSHSRSLSSKRVIAQRVSESQKRGVVVAYSSARSTRVVACRYALIGLYLVSLMDIKMHKQYVNIVVEGRHSLVSEVCIPIPDQMYHIISCALSFYLLQNSSLTNMIRNSITRFSNAY